MSLNILLGIIVILAIGVGIYFRILVSNGKNGERWAKRNMQGPFVPLSTEEIAEDEKRRNS